MTQQDATYKGYSSFVIINLDLAQWCFPSHHTLDILFVKHLRVHEFAINHLCLCCSYLGPLNTHESMLFVLQLYFRLFTAISVTQFSVMLDYISYFEIGHDLIRPQPFPFINLFILILPKLLRSYRPTRITLAVLQCKKVT
jgi:hypothetical protein